MPCATKNNENNQGGVGTSVGPPPLPGCVVIPWGAQQRVSNQGQVYWSIEGQEAVQVPVTQPSRRPSICKFVMKWLRGS
jgi:hypothetical protein